MASHGRRIWLVVVLAPLLSAGAASQELFFSEYIRGSGADHALEIFNPDAAPVDLAAADYDVQFYFDGASSPGAVIDLVGTIATGDVHVLVDAGAGAQLLARADQVAGGTWFDGDDAVVLTKAGVVMDAIGQVGFDPGSACDGDGTATDAFDPGLQWSGGGQFEGLGYFGCGGEPRRGVLQNLVENADVEFNGDSYFLTEAVSGACSNSAQAAHDLQIGLPVPGSLGLSAAVEAVADTCTAQAAYSQCVSLNGQPLPWRLGFNTAFETFGGCPASGGGTAASFGARLFSEPACSGQESVVTFAEHRHPGVSSTYLGAAATLTGDPLGGSQSIKLEGTVGVSCLPVSNPTAVFAHADSFFFGRAPVEPAGLVVDDLGNGVFEPAETARIVPSWVRNDNDSATFQGSLSSFQGPTAALPAIQDGDADYADAAGVPSCLENGGNCYMLQVPLATSRPTHWDNFFVETLSSGLANTWTLHIGDSFADVPRATLGPPSAYHAAETLLHFGIALGCGGGKFCPTDPVTRTQLAFILLRAKEGSLYRPNPCGSSSLEDVSASHPLCAWIAASRLRGMQTECAASRFCPEGVVTREQLALHLYRAQHGPAPPLGCTVPAATDVPVASPFCPYVRDLATTIGLCGVDRFCPSQPVSRRALALAITGGYGLNLQASEPSLNRPPAITSAAVVSVPENLTTVVDVESSDPDGETEGAELVYSLTGGADQAQFSLVASTGVLTFSVAPDFEHPADAGANNVYNVQVTVTDSGMLTDVQNLEVTVTDVLAPTLTITTATPLPGATVDVLYSTLLDAVGGSTPYAWNVKPPSQLPAGLNLTVNGANQGVISGTPTQSGSWTFTIQVSDSSIETGKADKTFTLFTDP